MMDDGLYLNGTWVSELDCSLVLQANDLTKPDAQTASFSNTFTLPDTELIRNLTQNAEQVDAGGHDPYRQLPAKLIEDGEVVFTGVAEFSSFQAGWNVNLFDGVVSFFDVLKDKELQDLDLSRLDHPWTLDYINSYAGATEGIVYPMVDYGSIIKSNVPYDTMYPAVYIKTLLHKIAEEAGYRLVGDWLDDEWLKKAALPFVEEEPTAHDDEWREARFARVTVTGVFPIPPFSTFDGILQLNRDNDVLNNWVDGKQNNYKADSCRYVCDVAMRLHVQAFQTFDLVISFGGVEAMLQVLVNGQNVIQEYFDAAGPLYSKRVRMELDEYIDCNQGDQIQIKFVLQKRTTFAEYSHVGFISEEYTYASFEPDIAIRLGDTWRTAINLPADITCQDLFMSVAKVMCGTFDVNRVKRTVELKTINSVVAKTATANDWSANVEESQEPELSVKFDGYGKRNLLKWKEADEKANVGFGDGLIEIDVTNLEPEAILFELPFAACINSDVSLGTYGNPVLIKTRTVKGEDENTTIEKNSTSPRIILIEPSKTVQVATTLLTPGGDPYDATATLTGCWWGVRPFGALTADNAFCLAFSPVSGSREQALIDRYFKGLKRILRRPRMLTVSMYLRSIDIATLDLYTPVRLKAVRAGSLDINNNSFYLNKLGPRRAGQTCLVTLIAIE